jgi:hypothetical protein
MAAWSRKGHKTGLIAAPGRVILLAPAAEHDNRLRLLGQPGPVQFAQGRLAFQLPRRPFHHHRQTHQPQAAQRQAEAGRRQPRRAPPQPPGDQQQQQENTRRHQQLFKDVANRHRAPPEVPEA